MARISDAIGYDVEVSEPNGPAVHGYITDRWANSRQPEFDRWLNSIKAEALREARDAVRASSFWADGSDNYADRVRGYLSARADRLAAEGGADRG